jgi:hypothetical protein
MTWRAPLAGRIAALLAVVLAGPLAIVSSAPAATAQATGPAATLSAAVTATPATVTATPATAAAAATAAKPVFFRTLPPGTRLPSSAHCAALVRRSPDQENKAANKTANHRTGQHIKGSFFTSSGDSPQAARVIAPRINGDFTGSTQDILRWAACKWGISQNVVFAQAAVESWWQQDTLGDWAADAGACPPGHKLGADGRPGQCPQSYGILQNRYPFEKAAWPGIGRSTAMNADMAYAIWRACYDGYETWLNTVPEPRKYQKGDLWGCVGRWFAGRWHTAPAQQYIAKVKRYDRERIWRTKDFQQG